MPVGRALAGRRYSLRCLPACALRHAVMACAFSVGALAGGSAWASGAPDGGAPTELDGPPVDIVGERPAGSARAPAAASTVIETSRFAGEVRTVAELLSSAPGVIVRSQGGPGQATTVSIRGAAPDQSLVLLDGVPLAGPGGGAIDLATLPSGLLERIVVSRGVLGAQLGSGALGGVVELEPRSAGAKGVQGGAQASFGSFGTAQVAGDLSGGSEGSSRWLGSIQLDRTGGAFDYDRRLTPELPDAPYYGETRSNADARRGAGLLRWSNALSDSLQASALAQASAGERGLPGPIGGLTPHARAKDANWVAGGRLQGLAGPAIWTARAWGRGSWIELHGIAPYGDCVDGDPGCPSSVSRSHAARAEGELRVPIGDSQWVSGLLSGGGETATGDQAGDHQRAVVAAVLADDVQLFAGRLLVHPALRVERVGDEVGWSPGVAAVLTPFAETSRLAPVEFRAGWGRSFRAPSFAELYLDQGGVAANPALRPERAWSADAGVAFRTEQVTASVGGFWSRYSELILYEQNPPARIKPYNLGAARIAGLEARLLIALPLRIFAEASYAFIDAVNQRDSLTQGGQKLAYRPPHHLFVRGAHRGDRFEGYLEADATTAMPRNQFGTASLPGRVLLNAGAGVRAVGPVWLDVEAKNLLDDRTQQDLFEYPLPGLSLAVIARARL